MSDQILPNSCNREGISNCCKKIINLCPKTAIATYKEKPHILEPEKVQLVDYSQNTYLVRGNMPVTREEGSGDRVFDYEAVMQVIGERLKEIGKTLSDDVIFADISFLNYVSDADSLDLEISWFDQHPSKGCIWVYPLVGTKINPVKQSKKTRGLVQQNMDVDGLTDFMGRLHQLVQSNCGKTFIIYMHCESGVDRAGEAAACYMMQYLGYSYEKAMAIDTELAGRPIKKVNHNAVRWYAHQLRDVKGMSSIGPIDGK